MTTDYNSLSIGVDYYPEHWPESRWETDARLMKEMGIEFVRMAEFAWEKMEPAEGRFEFGWLERAIELLAEYGIKTILGTPTAAPPVWIIRRNPEILPVTSRGQQTEFGGRHHDCQSNRVYRAHVERFVRAMATCFTDNPHVFGWQIDNELGNSHDDLCYCDSCESAFQVWLQHKYGTIEALNEAWGTAFWSQGYSSFFQLNAPRFTIAGHNPSQVLDWKLFCSDLIVDFQRVQAKILREICPHHIITHNYMGFAGKVNYYDLAEDLDFVSHDQYPSGYFAQDPQQPVHTLAASLGLMRSTKKQPFWIMEQQAGITGWDIMGRSPKPGQLGLWAAQSAAYGADAIVFFRWRTCTVGTEQYWHGILPHHGKPGRNYEELKGFATRMRSVLPEIKGAMPASQVALVYDYAQRYAMEVQAQTVGMNYVSELMGYYKPLHERHVAVDFVQGLDDLSGYKAVVAPLNYLMTEALAENYTRFVEGGGTLVLTMRTGVKDEYNRVQTEEPLPGLLRGLAGLEITEYDPLRGDNVGVEWNEAHGSLSHRGSFWADVIKTDTAEAVAFYTNQYYAGTPAVTVNRYGAGQVIYVGTSLDDAGMKQVAERFVVPLLDDLLDSPEGVEIVQRRNEKGLWTFVLNHTGEIKTLRMEMRGELVAGDPVGDDEAGLSVSPYDYLVFLESGVSE